jgi:hypothetical protein
MAAVCEPCTETVNDNYTLRTGVLTYCGEDGITRSVGNVQALDLTYTPNSIEHRAGATGSIDAVIPLSEDFGLVVTVDEMTPNNWGLLFGQDAISSVGECTIPLDRNQCAREFAIEFIHTFPCSDKTITIRLWRAIIAPVETTISFGGEEIISFPITIRAKDCASLHPGSRYGEIVFSEECPAS